MARQLLVPTWLRYRALAVDKEALTWPTALGTAEVAGAFSTRGPRQTASRMGASVLSAGALSEPRTRLPW